MFVCGSVCLDVANFAVFGICTAESEGLKSNTNICKQVHK